MDNPQKTKNRITICSSNPTPGHLSRENHDLKRHLSSDVQCSTLFNSQDMETTSMPIDRGVAQEEVVHINNGILLSHKKSETMPFVATWMDLELSYEVK